MNICILGFVFSSNHLCWCSSCSNNLSNCVRSFNNSNIQSIPCSCPCPVRAVRASLCLAPCRACPCSGCVLIHFLKTSYEVKLARFNCTCSGNKTSSELMRKSSAKVCAFPWASRWRLQRLTRSSILSMGRGGDRISLWRCRARHAVHGATCRETCANSGSHGHLLLT